MEYKYNINGYQLYYIHTRCLSISGTSSFAVNCQGILCLFQQHRTRKLKVIFPALAFQFERIKDEGSAFLAPAVPYN